MLTDKAKIDFEIYLKSNYDHLLYRFENSKTHLYDLLLADHIKKTDVLLNSVIIEWFDSVGINISTSFGYVSNSYNWTIPMNDGDYESKGFKTRTKAINSAIEQANELYNTTHP